MIVANHLSFLDPILFVSLFEKQKTIVKSDYFRLPVFGWILRTSGYIPSLGGGPVCGGHGRSDKKDAGVPGGGRESLYLSRGAPFPRRPDRLRSIRARSRSPDSAARPPSRWCSSGIPTDSFPRAGFCSIPAMKSSSRLNWPAAWSRTTKAKPFRCPRSWRRPDRSWKRKAGRHRRHHRQLGERGRFDDRERFRESRA